MQLGPGEVLLCLFVALVVLGPEQLPKAARNMGKALAELRKLNTAVQSQVTGLMQVDDDTAVPTNRKAKPAVPYQPPNIDDFKPIDEVVDTRPIAPPDDSEPEIPPTDHRVPVESPIEADSRRDPDTSRPE